MIDLKKCNLSVAFVFFPQVVSLRTKYIPLDVIETELLPSDVIKIKFYRPPNLKYLSGQWVRLACTTFKTNEFHSFTLTSAPHENFLSCHIKAQGKSIIQSFFCVKFRRFDYSHIGYPQENDLKMANFYSVHCRSSFNLFRSFFCRSQYSDVTFTLILKR